MDEYEKLEQRLKKLYQMYVQKYRNLIYLQKVQSEFDKADAERTMVKVLVIFCLFFAVENY